MARILYGVASEGFGHAARSKAVIEQLNKNNKIKVVTSAKAYSYLNKFFDVEKIDYFKIIYKENKVKKFLTLLNFLIMIPIIFAKIRKISKIMGDFKPDVVITDFENLVVYFAFLKNIPVISVGNHHIITEAHHKNIPVKYWFDELIIKIIIKLFIIKYDKNFISTFYDCKLKNNSSVLIKPVLRKDILNAKTSNKNNILVYQTSKSNEKLIGELQKINQKFIVYGFHENKNLGNVVLKDFSENGFLNDLKSCKAVITNGGFNVITESLYLKKPILSIPVKKQFEQILNAIYLERLGYGMFAEETSKEIIEEFIKKIPVYKNKLKNYEKYNNDEAIRKIEDAIKSLS